MPKQVPAFKKPLEQHGMHTSHIVGKLLQLQNDSHFVVRDLRSQDVFRRKETALLTKEEILNIAKRGRILFDELTEKYHIAAPVEFIVAADEHGRDTLFSAVEHVEEYKTTTKEEKDLCSQQRVQLYKNLLTYLTDKYDSGEDFLNDIFSAHQYVYGKRSADTAPQFYLIDPDPFYSKSSDPFIKTHYHQYAMDLLNELRTIKDADQFELADTIFYAEALLEEFKKVS